MRRLCTKIKTSDYEFDQLLASGSRALWVPVRWHAEDSFTSHAVLKVTREGYVFKANRQMVAWFGPDHVRTILRDKTRTGQVLNVYSKDRRSAIVKVVNEQIRQVLPDAAPLHWLADHPAHPLDGSSYARVFQVVLVPTSIQESPCPATILSK